MGGTPFGRGLGEVAYRPVEEEGGEEVTEELGGDLAVEPSAEKAAQEAADEVRQGEEEVEKMDALLSLAITGGDCNWI